MVYMFNSLSMYMSLEWCMFLSMCMSEMVFDIWNESVEVMSEPNNRGGCSLPIASVKLIYRGGLWK